MVSISQVIEELIEDRPFLESALSQGIINFGKLAESILEDISGDRRLREKKITHSSVMMALRRLGLKLNKQFGELQTITESVFKLDLYNTRYGLFELTVKRSVENWEKLIHLYKQMEIDRGDFLTITQGIYEITIISNQRFEVEIVKLFTELDILNRDTNLASISLRIPKDSIETPGLIYYVTKQLFWDNINIIEVVSTFTEITFIVKESDIPEAMKSLQKLVRREK
ncbi:MAG: hypothetical protein HeimC2_31660 [Candidatus Heimdallarchaeota archaeon LC_2]|nr:MAG: hypothetical protein HeimC2_31660 [Candidatus Heimdallarchaeota archaeon LC_2]